MTARTALAEGRLTEAVAFQEAAVRDTPDDAPARLFLFELLTLAGRLPEARDHLRYLSSDDPAWPVARRGFLHLLKAEYRRTHQCRRPAFLVDSPTHVKRRWNAARAVRDARPNAAAWVDRADAGSPLLSGHIDGREFVGLRDTDDRFGSVLEAFVGPEYVWLPFEQLRRVVLSPAAGVLDAAFRPARLTLTDGRELGVVLPMLYPGSHGAEGEFATGLETDWPEGSSGVTCGVGARVLMLGEEDVILGRCRQIDIQPG